MLNGGKTVAAKTKTKKTCRLRLEFDSLFSGRCLILFSESVPVFCFCLCLKECVCVCVLCLFCST